MTFRSQSHSIDKLIHLNILTLFAVLARVTLPSYLAQSILDSSSNFEYKSDYCIPDVFHSFIINDQSPASGFMETCKEYALLI